ncbi:MAG: RagB/SusD family nutrient uptake outer membrane protein [bacterium]
MTDHPVQNARRRKGGRFHGALTTSAALAAAALLAGCGHLLDATAPDRILSTTLDQPGTAQLLVNSAIADFGCAMQQYAVVTGQFTDELQNGNLSTQENIDLDKRLVSPGRTLYAVQQCNSINGIYTPLSVARFGADDILRKLEAYTDAEVANRTTLIATSAAYAGYGLVLLGEGFCTAAIDGGAELTPAQLFTQAEARFTRAIAAAGTGNASILNLAYVGRARARLDLGKRAEALADAKAVTAGFRVDAPSSSATPRSENRLYRLLVQSANLSVEPAFRDLTVNGVADPRVPVTNAGRMAADGTTPLWTTSKFASLNAPVRIASYTEAQLIAAEIEGGQSAVNVINTLHTANGLPAFVSVDEATIQAQVAEERRREFFLEGQHLGDLRRRNVPLAPTAGTPYFNTAKGGVYGPATCFPLPDIERNANPTLKTP